MRPYGDLDLSPLCLALGGKDGLRVTFSPLANPRQQVGAKPDKAEPQADVLAVSAPLVALRFVRASDQSR